MAKWWLSMAVAAIGLGGTAWAQNPYMPNAGQPTVMPDPIPYSAQMTNQPALAPGPTQPTESSPPLDLRGDLPNGWSEDVPTDPAAVYFSLGYLGYQRQRLGHSPAAFLDQASGGVDTGNPPPIGSREVLDFHDINPRFTSGTRVMLGYHCGTSAIEASGFYVGQSSSSKQIEVPGSLDVPFSSNGNPFIFPRGFEGDNGMWLQADVVRVRLQTALGSGEVNYRWWLGSDSNFSWTLGVRYLDIYERFGLYTGDDDLTVLDVFGHPDPTRQALYQVTSQNRIVAPQLGLEWNRALNCWLAFSLMAKGAWGVNFLDVDTLLKRGDGFVGFTGHRSDTIFSHLYEFGLYGDISLRENIRLRVGYNFLWALDVAPASAQLDFNLLDRAGKTDNRGSIFYHGPMVELHILF